MTYNIGIIGFGRLGKFLAEELDKLDDFKVEKIWNRSPKVDGVWTVEPIEELLKESTVLCLRQIDLIVEVAHPKIVAKYGPTLLRHSNLFIGSPTALADETVSRDIIRAAEEYKRSVFVPSGAFWGGEDIQKMARADILTSLNVTMVKHPTSFRQLGTPLKELNESALESGQRTVLYYGPVRQLCPLAPNNVNTMAGAAVAAQNLGFDGVTARLISDPNLKDYHEVQVEVCGKNGFHCMTTRKNPAKVGNVTGMATYYSFLASIKNTRNKLPGLQIC